MDWTIRTTFPSVTQLSTAGLQEMLDKPPDELKVLLFDVREPEEQAVSRIAGAVSVSPQVHKDADSVRGILPAGTAQLPTNDGGSSSSSHGADLEAEEVAIVCYCSVGYRSSQLASAICKAAPEWKGRTFNLEGSIFRWANEGRPVVDSNGSEVLRVHPFSSVWGKALNASLRHYT